jgi:hypothetical protein
MTREGRNSLSAKALSEGTGKSSVPKKIIFTVEVPRDQKFSPRDTRGNLPRIQAPIPT